MVRKISKGNNFLNENSELTQVVNNSEFYYSDNLMDIFERDTNLKKDILYKNTDFFDYEATVYQ